MEPKMQKFLSITIAAAFSCTALAATGFPSDIAAFITHRDDCDHFRGEEPYNAERAKFLNAQIKQLCAGTDKSLAQLKAKYKANKDVLAKLNDYEPNIETTRK